MNHVRARDLGVPFDGTPGVRNAITDVPGVEVGFVTRSSGAVQTGVTAVLPRGRAGVGIPCAAATFSLNGNGELTGRSWIDESGSLSLPVLLTNSHAVGSVHRGVIDWIVRERPELAVQWQLPVVGETWDGYLNDINGGHVSSSDAGAAIDAATAGRVAEGSVGGGTGMNCYGFKGGTGSASRLVTIGDERYTVGVLLQANFGSRAELRLAGVPLGRRSSAPNPMETTDWFERDGERAAAVPGAGSVIAVVGTDAPLLPGQLAAVARRVPLGLARTGTTGSHFSGDIFLAFSTANAGAFTSRMPTGPDAAPDAVLALPWGRVDPLYAATVEAVEEAVANALVAARDVEGRDGHRSYALPHEEVSAAFSA
ncbi:P1 family peptidase [uncultured Leifsonia sp.]|uniref:DmpA family aminopeptidase n=1 Tax=Leifsonia sp. TaxID=1870902 RepID=UPI0028D5B691|nr:P1 family peptidase [uncultured Leifsonia sp.]